jgi:hypothetical protein
LPDHGIIIPLNAAVLLWQVPCIAATMLSQLCEQAQNSQNPPPRIRQYIDEFGLYPTLTFLTTDEAIPWPASWPGLR